MKSLAKINGKITGLIVLMVLLTIFSGVAIAQKSASFNPAQQYTAIDQLIERLYGRTEGNYLVVSAQAFSFPEYENEEQLEMWMVDIDCWCSGLEPALCRAICIEEVEKEYEIEDWMLSGFDDRFRELPLAGKEDGNEVSRWMTMPLLWGVQKN